jgi:hypothetical protein
MKKSIVFAFAAFGLVACDKSSKELEAKLNQLEKQASAATDRQKQLEIELAEQKLMAERDAVERERTLIEEERLAMQDEKSSNKTALEKIEKREEELSKREEKIWKSQEDLDSRQSQISGAERRLNQNDLSQAGRRPLRALPATQKTYTSGPTGDYRNFYEPLGSYGSWFQTRDFGYVYQPTVVRDLSWRPYTRGRWAFTNQGWTWVSNEPFGWACYHYGRWAQLRGHGWVWVPGSQWAPAWVTWRESSGHIGWAPLPPETLAWRDRSWDASVEVNFRINRSWFSFVSYRHFGNNIQPYCLPAAQNTVIYQNTTNITNYNIQQNNVFVGGPSYQNVTQQIGRQVPIQTLSLDQNPDFGRGGRVISSQVKGDTLEMVAPNMDAEWNSALVPTKVGDALGKVEVERTEQLAPEVKEEFQEYQVEQVKEAKALVSEAGGIKAFEQERTELLEQGREEVAKIEQIAPPSVLLTENAESAPKQTVQESATEPEITKQDSAPSIAQKEPEVIEKNTKVEVLETIEPSAETEPSVTKAEEIVEQKQTTPAVIEQKEEPKITVQNQEPEAPVKQADDSAAQLEASAKEEAKEDAKADAEEVAQRASQEEAQKQSQTKQDAQAEERAEAQQAAQAKAEAEREQAQAEAQQLAEAKAQAEAQAQEREQAAREQAQAEAKQEQLRAQQEQQERLREQQEQQERMRAQQEEQQRREEQQERMRAQQEEQQRREEQQERMREQQEQQERMREQQEQQERMRAQQEEQQRRQEQQEQMRAQQEEMMRRQQEQEERMQQQQEQQQQQQQPSFGE